jgi:integrase
MPTVKLTAAAASRLRPPTDCVNKTYWDSQCPGFGLRISAKGRRTWVCMYRCNGRAIMETIGTQAVIPDVAAARALARASMVKARAGTNPVEQRREEAAAQEAEAKAKQKTFAWLIAHSEQGKHGEVTKGFLAEYASRNQRLSTQYETKRTLKRAMPYLGDKLLSEITRSDITELLDDIAAKRQRRTWKDGQGGPNGEARAIHATLNTVFNWAVAEQHIAVSPMATLSKSRHGKPQDRERTLDAEEIRALWSALDEIGWPFGPIGKLLLLTGQRAGEVVGMRHSELRDAGRWTLPSDRTKNGRAHTVYLSPQALEIIDALPRVDDTFVFTTTGKDPVTGFSIAKARVDKMMAAALDRPLTPWVWHDLRRTTATGMAENGTAPHIVESVLNHVSGHKAGIRGVYNRAAYGPAREAAMNSWGKHIDGLLGRGGDDNVVVLRAVDLHKTAID